MRLPPLERLAVLVQHGPTWTLPRSLSREIAAHLIGLLREVDDTDLTEENIDRMVSEGTPVDICEEPHQTIEEEDDCERVRTSVTRAGLTALVAQAIRDAACNGNCHEEEEICMDQRIQPFVWHHGILHEVMGRPEVIAAVTVDAMQEITERRVAAERQSYEKHADILRRARKSHTDSCPVASGTFKRPTWGCSMCDILGITTAEVDAPRKRLLCPQCGEDITDYSEDDHVFLTGDERPYCSGECVRDALRAEAHPRCPHCHLPHDLTPGSLPVRACESILASLAEAKRLHGEGDHNRCARVDCDVVRERRATEAQQPECVASRSGNCLREAESQTACDTEAGECVHGGRPIHEAVVLADDVAYLLDHLHTPPHAHMTPGIWDTSRKPCHHCARIDLIRTHLTAFQQDDT